MLIEKLIWLLDSFGALLDCSTVVRIWLFCAGVRVTDALVCEFAGALVWLCVVDLAAGD